jgi:predicted ABC-type ATPase
MSAANIPRLRMFAGPNGSGKSTIKLKVSEEMGGSLFSYYINSDEIEAKIKKSFFLNFSRFNLEIEASEVLGIF